MGEKSKREGIYVQCIADSLHCTVETNATCKAITLHLYKKATVLEPETLPAEFKLGLNNLTANKGQDQVF